MLRNQLEIENRLLGNIIINEDKETCLSLNESMFTYKQNKKVFTAILSCINNKEDIDIANIHKNSSVSISDITEYVSEWCISGDKYKSYIPILKDEAKKRTLRKNMDSFLKEIDNVSGNELDTKIFALLNNVGNFANEDNNSQSDDIQSVAMRMLDLIEYKQSDEYKLNKERLGYGLPWLDHITYGCHKGEMTTIAGRSGLGKTALALNFFENLSFKGVKVGFVTREMSDVQIFSRLTCKTGGISQKSLRSGNFTEDEMKKIIDCMNMYSKTNALINDKLRTPNEIIRWAVKNKLEVVIVDYMQLLQPDVKMASNRPRELGLMGQQFKSATTDYNLNIILLSQMNQKEGDKRPKGEGVIRESTTLYQDSSNVFYLHEPNVEEMTKYIDDGDVTQEMGEYAIRSKSKFVELIVDKQRDGENGRKLYFYHGPKYTYHDLEINNIKKELRK